eukprot:9499807-Pyramimonas_sp.AAC.1
MDAEGAGGGRGERGDALASRKLVETSNDDYPEKPKSRAKQIRNSAGSARGAAMLRHLRGWQQPM